MSNIKLRYTGDFYGGFVERIYMSLIKANHNCQLCAQIIFDLQFFYINYYSTKNDIFFIHFVTRSGFAYYCRTLSINVK